MGEANVVRTPAFCQSAGQAVENLDHDGEKRTPFFAKDHGGPVS
jgi:hypothetical protein